MLNLIRPRLLRWMRVPPEPAPPFGAPGSIRVFRAGANFYYVRLVRWLLAQVGAAIGILFSVGFITGLRSEYDAAAEARAARQQAAAIAEAAPTVSTTAPVARTDLPKDARSRRNRERAKQAFVERVPPWVMPLIEIVEVLGILGFLLQLPFTFAAVRLDWELRWYIVTDHSLRIRAGLWSLQESTMNFANLQQVEVRQGPLQRLLGIADVRVQSAGGGGGETKGQETHDSLHTGVLAGVDQAAELRDLILARLKQFRETGLGDPDDTPVPSAAAHELSDADPLSAAHELLDEARTLRRTLS